MDFIYKDYYCCEENDTMRIFGRLGVDHPPKTSPKWCPLRYGNGKNVESDLIKIKSDIQLTDKWGKPIYIRTPEPEYMCEIFGAQK